MRIRLSQLFRHELIAKDNALSTTSAIHWQKKLFLSFQSYQDENFILFWTLEGRSGNNDHLKIRIILDDSIVMNEFAILGDNTNYFRICSGWDEGSTNPGMHEIKMEYKSVNQKEVFIRKARIWLIDK